RAGPGCHGFGRGRTDGRGRHGRGRRRQRPREDCGDRAAPRNGSHRTRLHPQLGLATRGRRGDGRAPRPQHRRRRDERRGHGPRGRAAGGARRRHSRRGRRGGDRGASASRRRPPGRRTARGSDRAEPRLQRSSPRARLVRRHAVPDAVVPCPVRDPEPEDHRPRPRGRRPLRDRAAESVTTLLTNAHVVTMDDAGTEYENGWILFDEGLVKAAGAGPKPQADAVHDLAGAVVTPGLGNTHHHLWQNLTRARAQDENLFGWLKALYPVWAAIDEEAEYAAARAGLAELALSGCTTVFDHHYLFPPGVKGLLEAEIWAARELGVRIVASRGSMDLGESQGGLPPDAVVETRDEALAATEAAAGLADGAQVEITVAPCSPFSVTRELMTESAELARRLG